MTVAMPRIAAPDWLTPPLARDWQRLATAGPPPDRFDPALVADLPGPARRWLTHAIAPGTPLRRSVVLEQHGEIRLGGWRPFRATQILAPLDGFIWAVTTRVAGVPMSGFDRLTRGEGQLRHLAWGKIPVVSADGPDLTRSAAGRLAAEAVLVPAVGVGEPVSWWPVNDRQAAFRLRAGGGAHSVTLTVDGAGALTRVALRRWVPSGRNRYAWRLFTVEVQEEATFEGFTVPSRLTAGYDDLAGGGFIRLTIDRATYL